jgi:hypothetical protein
MLIGHLDAELPDGRERLKGLTNIRLEAWSGPRKRLEDEDSPS